MNVDLQYRPREWQKKCHKDRSRFRVIALHRRGGKALDVNTPIPMASGGFKRMGDLMDGDVIFDETGKPCNVLYAHDVMFNRECYEVKFSDGATIVADAEHLWYTETKLDRTYRKNRIRKNRKMSSGVQERKEGTVKTTKEIFNTLHYCGENNHSIPVASAVQHEEKELPIPSYILGAWLGDGHSETARITNMDQEVIEKFLSYAESIGASFNIVSCNYGSKAKTYSITGGDKFQTKLSKLGVLNNKHIPEIYLSASIEQRKELLRGLMDTDGSIDKDKPCCEITQKRKGLALEIIRLIRSLGMMCSMAEKIVNGTSYWRIHFRANYNCFTIKRKVERYHDAKKTAWVKNRFIVSVEKVESRPVRCISVDSPNKLYLASEWFVPTHNSTFATMELINSALQFDKELGLFAFVAPFLSQAKSIAWGMIKHRLKPLIEAKAVHINEAELTATFMHNEAKIRLFGGDNYDALRGVRLDGIVMDEVAQIRPELWENVVQPALSDRKGWAIFIGTPDGVNMFSEKYYKALTLPEWSAHLFTVYDTDAIDKEEVDRLVRDMAPSAFQREYMCSFESAGDDQLISLSEIETACARVYKPDEFHYAPRVLGVDPARFGSDSSVIVKRQGFIMYSPIAFNGMDNMNLADQVAYHIKDWQADAVFIDSGNGGGVIDRLRQLGHSVIEVGFGSKSAQPTKFANKKAEIWAATADWLREGGYIPNHARLRQDLATPKYWYDKMGRITIESKEDIKSRGLPSSDYADALCLTFAAPVNKKNREDFLGRKVTHEYNYDPLSSNSARGL